MVNGASLDTLNDAEARLAEIEHDPERQFTSWSWLPVVQSLRALCGINQLAAIILVAELGDLLRFEALPASMAYLVLTPSEHSSGKRRHIGGITETGNSAARRVLIKGAWKYRYPPRVTYHLLQKAREASDYTRELADFICDIARHELAQLDG